MQLSKNFALREFLVSSQAARRGWRWPEPPPEVVAMLRKLAQDVGEPLRAALGHQPVVITSGWRYRKLNRLVKGARNSAHITGRSMDIVVPGLSARQVAYVACGLAGADKTILEFDEWVHIQIPRPGRSPRNQALCAYSDFNALGRPKTCYATGLVPPQGWE